MDKHLKIMSLITAATLLLVSAAIVASMQAGLLGPLNIGANKISKTEVRAMYDPNLAPVVEEEVQLEETLTETSKQ